MTDENENRPARAPLTLKPRSGSISTGTVKQSFSHGRSKTVVVETKRSRAGSPNLAAPSVAERRPPGFDVRGPQPTGRSAPAAQGATDAHGLSEDERQRRQKVAAEFARQQAERAAAEARTREAASARAREEVAKTAPPPVEAPVAEARVEAPRPTPRPEGPRPEAPRPAAPGQTRTYDPSTARRDDRERTTTYRPDRPAGP